MRKTLGIFVIIIGMYAGLLLVGAGTQLNTTGIAMESLKSESGTSLAEIYYQDMGGMSVGLGSVALAVKDKLLPVVFLHGGWGKIGAAGSTQYAIDRWQPQLLINLGTCGGFAGDIALGEIVLANRTIVYDIIEQQGDFEAAIASYTTTLDVSWLQEYPHEVKETLLVSADRDLLIDEVPMLRDRHGAIAGDWESGAIAYIAKRNGVPCLILRGVSDIVAPSGNDTYGNMPAFVVGTELVMSKLLTNLPQWLAVIDPAIVALE